MILVKLKKILLSPLLKYFRQALVFLLLTALPLLSNGQLRYRFNMTWGPNVTTGNSFEGGTTSVSTPDLTGAHTIHSMFSILWGFPNPEYSFMQNFARKFAWGGRFEVLMTERKSATLGLEFGSRGYIIKSEQSNNLLETYRNISIPIIYTHNGRAGYFWTFRKHFGMSMNFAQSFEKLLPGEIQTLPAPQWYPALYVGAELANLNIRGPVCFEVAYQHSLVNNVIDARYLALDYSGGVPIWSSGSAFKFLIKWNFGERSFWLKSRSKTRETPDIKEIMASKEFFFREIKRPEIVKVRSGDVKVCFMDDQTIDDDSITVEYNSVLILDGLRLTREVKCANIKVLPGQGNQMVIHAVNEGRIPPNTYEIRIYDGQTEQVLKLKSDMQKSAAIRFERD